jgi:uncharacterized RDD family membrane protein YckC
MTDNMNTPSLPAVHYIGFWPRVLASLVDSIVLLLAIVPIWLLYRTLGGAEPMDPTIRLLMDWGLMMAVVLAFWVAAQATPGKMLVRGIIVDAETFQPVGFGRLVLRYVAYYVSIIPLLLGFFWVGWDARKQGFHDKIARTVVIRKPIKA